MRIFLRILLLLLPFSGYTQRNDSAWIVKNYNKIERYIPMRDGVKLFTAIYIPKDDDEKHPILLNRTPYSCAPYGEDKFKPFWETFIKEYCNENYIMVYQDVRGRWMSEGEFVDVRPFNPNKKTDKDVDEASDTYDTIEWLLQNIRSNNGNVGSFGTSYPGFYATMAALSNHPALKAVSPQAPVTDWFMGDDFHHNGAFMLMDAFAFYSSFGKPRPLPTTVGPTPFNYPTKDNYRFYLETGALSNFSKKYIGDTFKFWTDMMKHPNYDAWWKARNVRNFVQNVKPAMLVVGGLFDAEDVFGAWKTYEAIEKKSPATNNRIVMGPWYHGGWYRSEGSNLGNVQFQSKTSEWYQKNIEIPFFQYYLKGKGTDKNIAEASIFFTGENNWRLLPKWPPAGMQKQDLFLNAKGKLSWNKPATTATSITSATFTEYVSDPAKPVPYTEDVHFRRTREYMTDDQRFAARRPDVLVFETDTLQNDITLAGPVIADLMVSITGTDADFIVKVIDVFPDKFSYAPDDKYLMDGYQMLVRGEVMRGKFRNSFERPEPFIPNKVTNVKFELPDVAHTFKKGHRIMIQVQSSWFPLVDRNPQKFIDIYHAKDEDFQKATIRIYHSGNAASKITLPVVR
jgi:putative CocE/NonD family hydrolase